MNKIIMAWVAMVLSACVYSETPYGRYAHIDLPVHHQTTINKTVTVNAPAGTTVIMSESVPVSAYGQNSLDCHNSRHQRCQPRPVYRIQGQGGSVSQTQQGVLYRY